ncbi:Isoquinoline 1-oxidoreductase subunit [Marinobacter caseinilyticus]|uniref:Isoquinoline 1-oxidoreductase subunit n=1 Tax=Marinobacter caseinilyticus TaxID=2692195 RepID=UPI001407281F|nr:Isoquinoline 1-oxidoreductase subunit [Marinobacter caseinilyticus]
MKDSSSFRVSATLVAGLMALAASSVVADRHKGASAELKSPLAFQSITDPAQRSMALFKEMGKVITHPRCMNCHPRGDSPTQGMMSQKHEPPVVRGAGGLGAPGMRCTTCHGPGNVAYTASEGSIPGHPTWRLAPPEQAWQGKSLAQICEQLKDQSRSHMTLAELQAHNAEDSLVGWGWHPGEGRQSVPGSQKVFGALTQAWIDTGAVCPEN